MAETTPTPSTGKLADLRPYLSDRFEFAAPGDRQRDVWFLRFSDPDIREQMFSAETYEDPEAAAWDAWDRYAPAYNCYVFQLARFPTSTDASAAFAAGVEAAAQLMETIDPIIDYLATGKSINQATRDHLSTAIRAIPTTAGDAGVRARPLKWRKPTDHPQDDGCGDKLPLWVAHTIGGRYRIEEDSYGVHLWGIEEGDEFRFETFKSVVEAKNAAEKEWQEAFAASVDDMPHGMPRDMYERGFIPPHITDRLALTPPNPLEREAVRAEGISCPQIAMGHGLVDVGPIYWQGRTGIILHPRSGHIPLGKPGELSGDYWPTNDDVVIWIDKPEGATVIIDELAALLTPTIAEEPVGEVCPGHLWTSEAKPRQCLLCDFVDEQPIPASGGVIQADRERAADLFEVWHTAINRPKAMRGGHLDKHEYVQAFVAHRLAHSDRDAVLLRAEGWSVAVHNDYRLNGEAFTFWLWTHPSGRYVKGEGRTDADALAQCVGALKSHPQDGGSQG